MSTREYWRKSKGTILQLGMQEDTWVFTDKHYGWVNVEETEFIDIEETPFGDLMHFEYRQHPYSSRIVFGSKPG